MTRFDWDKARPQKPKERRQKTETVKVHPNSMAARKWGRKTWRR